MAFQLRLEPEEEEEEKQENDNNVEVLDNIRIKQISENEVYTKQKQFNSSNHPYSSLNDDIKEIERKQLSEDEYFKILENTKYNNYAKLISKNNNDRFSISLNEEQVDTLYKANEEGIKCGGIPEKYEKEIRIIIQYIKQYILKSKIDDNSDGNNNENEEEKKEGKNYFVRLDSCSPKDTIYGFGPFNIDSINFLVSALCASQRCGVIFKRYSKIKSKLLLWFVEWRKDINIDNEFRCFVYNKKLTAISQYKWMQAIPKWSDDSNYKILYEMVSKVEVLIDKICKSLAITQFTLDIHITLNNNTNESLVEIIELNSFGVQMACGSGLFHWINDFKQLYGFNDKMEIRIVK